MMSRRHLAIVATISFGLAALAARPTVAAPTLGFREHWAGTSTQGWAGGAPGLVITNPGTGGTLGAGDGYLLLTMAADGNFGARSTGSEYIGDWLGAGIEVVRVSLQDVGAPDDFEIHLCIGNASNFWQYIPGFVPPIGSWQEFSVNMADGSQWTRIIGSGTFAQALQTADRILLRNDHMPFVQTPDPTHGDLGIDQIVLTAVATRTRTTSWARIKQLYR